MAPAFNNWTFIFLLAVAQGLFLSIVIFSRKSKVSNLLATVILLFSIMLGYYVTYWTGYNLILPRFIGVLGGLTFVFTPILYFYLKSDKNQFHFNILHFIPFLLFAIYYFTGPYLNIKNNSILSALVAVAQCIHLMVYFLLMYPKAIGKPSKIMKWKKLIALSFMGYALTFLLYYILVWTGYIKIEYDYMISMASSFFIYFVGYQSFRNPDILKTLEGNKYSNTQLTDAASLSILKTIENQMVTNKPYLDSDLKLHQLAKQLSLSTNQVSQVINEQLGLSFSDYINKYRVTEAMQILTDPTTAKIKLIHLAIDVGFNNKASFNNAFKRLNQCTPTEFVTANNRGQIITTAKAETKVPDFSRNIAN